MEWYYENCKRLQRYLQSNCWKWSLGTAMVWSMGRYSAPPIITTYHILNYFLMSLTKMSPYHAKMITTTLELFHLLMSVKAFVQFQLLINALPDKQLTECCDKWSYKGNFTLLFPKGVQTYTRVSPSPRPSSTFRNRNANPNKNSASDC